MTDSINGISSLSPQSLNNITTNPVDRVTKNFGDMLSGMVSQVNSTQISGDQAIAKLQSGEARHLHEVMIAVEEADVSLRMLVQLRNKAMTAYEEIMRMQI